MLSSCIVYCCCCCPSEWHDCFTFTSLSLVQTDDVVMKSESEAHVRWQSLGRLTVMSSEWVSEWVVVPSVVIRCVLVVVVCWVCCLFSLKTCDILCACCWSTGLISSLQFTSVGDISFWVSLLNSSADREVLSSLCSLLNIYSRCHIYTAMCHRRNHRAV